MFSETVTVTRKGISDKQLSDAVRSFLQTPFTLDGVYCLGMWHALVAAITFDGDLKRRACRMKRKVAHRTLARCPDRNTASQTVSWGGKFYLPSKYHQLLDRMLAAAMEECEPHTKAVLEDLRNTNIRIRFTKQDRLIRATPEDLTAGIHRLVQGMNVAAAA